MDRADLAVASGGPALIVEELQQDIPAGLTLKAELRRPGAVGRAFSALDSRGATDEPVKRVVRILSPPAAAEEDWREPLWQRLRTLLAGPLPYVATPREAIAASGDAICLVCDDLDRPLAAHIQTDAGCDPKTSADLLEQILTGLAALHRLNIAHGDLRPRNVFLREMDDTNKAPTAWIGNTALGGLAWWSKGAVVDADSAGYFPPEWQGRAGKPSFQADLYALGVIACELARGSASNPVRNPPEGSDGDRGAMSWLKRAAAELKDRMTGTAASGLIRLLLQDESRRPRDAGEALERFRRLRGWIAWRNALTFAAVVALLCMVALLGAWRARAAATAQAHRLDEKANRAEIEKSDLEHERKQLQEKLARIQKDSITEATRLKGELKEKEGQLYEARRKLAESKNQPSPPREDPILKEAKILWGEHSPHKSLNDVKSKYEELRNGGDDETILAKHLSDWWRQTNDLRIRSEPWIGANADEKMNELFVKSSSSPWEDAARKNAHHRLDSLNEAGKKWNEWASRKVPFNELRGLIPAVRDGEVEKILSEWLSDFQDRTNWTIRFHQGTAPAGYGTYRRISVKGDDWLGGKFHNWSDPKKHTYPEGRCDFKFNWHAGDAIVIAMEGERSVWRAGYRPYLLDETTFSGPLAIWKAHKEGKVKQDEFSLEFEVLDCPGPPRGVLRDILKDISIK